MSLEQGRMIILFNMLQDEAKEHNVELASGELFVNGRQKNS